jgi:hypothetical protein
VLCLFPSIKQRVCSSYHALQACFSRWTKPSTTSLVLGTLADMTRGKSHLLAENALWTHTNLSDSGEVQFEVASIHPLERCGGCGRRQRPDCHAHRGCL